MTSKKAVTPKARTTGGSWAAAFERLIILLEIFKQNNAAGMTIKEIRAHLDEKGIKTTVRSIQRLMVELEVTKLFQRFPLADGKAFEALWTLTPRAVQFLGMPKTPAYLNIILCKNQSGSAGMTSGETHEHVSKT